MAQNNANGSNKAKHLRRAKRKNTLLLRTLKERHSQWFTTMTTLLAVLAQHGGEVTITQGTAQQAVEGFVKGEVGFDTVAGKIEGEFVVRLVSRVKKAPEVIQTDSEGVGVITGGFDSEGEYQYATPVEVSDALLAEEGVPFEVIGQIGKDDME